MDDETRDDLAETSPPDADLTFAADSSLEPESEPEREAPQRSRGSVALPAIAALLVIAAVLTLVVSGIARGLVSTPLVVGLPYAAAQARVHSAELTQGAVLVRIEPGYPSGSVIEQKPVVGIQVPRETRVDLVIAEAARPATVPDVGLAPSEIAVGELRERWLTPVEASQLSSSVPFGRIVSQLPAPGTTLMSADEVAIVISEGPGKGGVPVPNLLGKKAADAAAILASVHLFPSWINATSASPTQTPVGAVAGQAIAPGGLVQVGALVPLTLSPAK